jgi:hypothetical protein
MHQKVIGFNSALNTLSITMIIIQFFNYLFLCSASKTERPITDTAQIYFGAKNTKDLH